MRAFNIRWYDHLWLILGRKVPHIKYLRNVASLCWGLCMESCVITNFNTHYTLGQVQGSCKTAFKVTCTGCRVEWYSTFCDFRKRAHCCLYTRNIFLSSIKKIFELSFSKITEIWKLIYFTKISKYQMPQKKKIRNLQIFRIFVGTQKRAKKKGKLKP